ncbi:MAG: hypothetical protein ABEH89_01380 [bacterium]
MNDSLLITVLAALLLSLSFSPANSQKRIKKFSIGFDGVPLKYERVRRYDHPFPDVKGLVVQSAQESDPTVKAGLRVGNIISSINGRPVSTRYEIREIVVDNFGETLTFNIHKRTPRSRHRKQQDPYYEADKGEPYKRATLFASYDTPGLRKNPVVSGNTRELYHKKKYRHSPDTRTNKIYRNPTLAQKEGLQACPVCLPQGESQTLETLIEDRLTQKDQFIESLTKGAPEVESPPEGIRAKMNRLTPFLLTKDIDPKVTLYKADKMFSFGLSSGQILITQNLYKYAESNSERAVLLSQLLAHADREHDHKPAEENQIRSLLERAIQRTTGVDFKFQKLKEWSPALPGFEYYQEVLEQGYGDVQSREAIFYGMVYLYQGGYDLEAVTNWLDRRRDMQENVHPYWLDYTLAHPIPFYIDYHVERWRKLIPKNFERKISPESRSN